MRRKYKLTLPLPLVGCSNSSAELSSGKANKYSIWPKWMDDELIPDKKVSRRTAKSARLSLLATCRLQHANSYSLSPARNPTNPLAEMLLPGHGKGQCYLQE